MAALLRLLLALCLAATAVPGPLALAATLATAAGHDAHATDLPPCHGSPSEGATDRQGDAADDACCAGEHAACGADCGCGCVPGAGLLASLPHAGATPRPADGPTLGARSTAPPRGSPPIRPPIG